MEAAYVMVTIQAGRGLAVGEPSNRLPVPRAEPRRSIAPRTSAESWEQLDHIDLGEAFTIRDVQVVLQVFEGTSALRFGGRTKGTEPSEVGKGSGCGDPCLEVVRVDPHVAPPQATSFWHSRT